MLPMQGPQVQSLVRELDSTCTTKGSHGATKELGMQIKDPACHNWDPARAQPRVHMMQEVWQPLLPCSSSATSTRDSESLRRSPLKIKEWTRVNYTPSPHSEDCWRSPLGARSLFTKQKSTHRHRKQTYMVTKKDALILFEGGDKLGVWD